MSICWVDMSVWMTSTNYGATTCHVLLEEQRVIWVDVAGSLLLLGAWGRGWVPGDVFALHCLIFFSALAD